MFGRFLTSDGYGLNLLSLSKAAILTLAPVVEGLLFLVVILQRRGNGYNLTRVIAETSMLVVLMVLASPLAWMATYTALLLPVFLAVGQTYEMLRLRRCDVCSSALAALAGFLAFLLKNTFWRAIGIFYWKSESYV